MHHPPTLALNDRTSIDLPRPGKIIHCAKQHYTPRHQDAVIHRLSCRRRRRGPKTKEQDDNHIHARPQIDRYAQNAGDAEGTPDEVAGVGVRFNLGGIGGGGRRDGDGVCHAAVEEEGATEEV